ncbi:hypothetical protein WG66_016759 [Moniliophthora roreri]|uniref:Uncharacterized protein n=1 Tax=Moniliophthora roreri TaxID=221103 RepID=A0A0W0G6R2_MONRR|nr:hypothetical protein WG66_016759 [Moniliophthora roreri]
MKEQNGLGPKFRISTRFAYTDLARTRYPSFNGSFFKDNKVKHGEGKEKEERLVGRVVWLSVVIGLESKEGKENVSFESALAREVDYRRSMKPPLRPRINKVYSTRNGLYISPASLPTIYLSSYLGASVRRLPKD